MYKLEDLNLKEESELNYSWQSAKEEKERYHALFAQAEKEAASAEETVARTKGELDSVLAQYGFASVEDFRSILLEREVLETREKENRDFFTELALLKQTAETSSIRKFATSLQLLFSEAKSSLQGVKKASEVFQSQMLLIFQHGSARKLSFPLTKL